MELSITHICCVAWRWSARLRAVQAYNAAKMPKEKWVELIRQTTSVAAASGGVADSKCLEAEIRRQDFSDQRLGQRFCCLTAYSEPLPCKLAPGHPPEV